MKRNINVIKDFIKGIDTNNRNLRSFNNKLFYYDTCIAQVGQSKVHNIMIVNKTIYNGNSLKIIKLLLKELDKTDYVVYEINNVAQYSKSLCIFKNNPNNE